MGKGWKTVECNATLKFFWCKDPSKTYRNGTRLEIYYSNSKMFSPDKKYGYYQPNVYLTECWDQEEESFTPTCTPKRSETYMHTPFVTPFNTPVVTPFNTVKATPIEATLNLEKLCEKVNKNKVRIKVLYALAANVAI